MFEKLRRVVARWIWPEVDERYVRLMGALRRVEDVVGYDFPTATVVSRWVMGAVVKEDSDARLLGMLGRAGEEAPELATRLSSALTEDAFNKGVLHEREDDV